MSLLTQEEHQNVSSEMELQMLHAGIAAGSLVAAWLGMHGTRPETNASPKIWARNILRFCNNSGWLYDPALLLNLLREIGVTPRTAFGQHIPTLIEEIKLRKPDVTQFYNGGSAWETCHLSLTLPFLNRSETRRAFEYFDEQIAMRPDAARVLIVNGPPGSGKTFTGDFLRLLIGLRPNHLGIAEADFSTWAGQPLAADALVGRACRRYAISDPNAGRKIWSSVWLAKPSAPEKLGICCSIIFICPACRNPL